MELLRLLIESVCRLYFSYLELIHLDTRPKVKAVFQERKVFYDPGLRGF